MNSLRKTVRPKAHAAPRENAMYRTFASLYSRGKYHIFFEHFPFSLGSSHRYVGHVESDDLVFWKHKSIAIYPTKKDDFDGSYEGSALEDGEGITLFYVGVNYTVRDEEDVNSHVSGTPVITNLMCCHSSDIIGFDFDNVRKKRTILTDGDFVKLGFQSGSVRDPEAYQVDEKTRYLTFLALDPEGRQAVGFLQGVMGKGGDYSYSYLGKDVLPKKGMRIRTLRFFQREGTGLYAMEANFPPLRSGGEKLPEFRVFLGFGSVDFEKCKISLGDEKKVVPLDYGYDLRAPKVAYDTRNLPYVVCSMVMEHEIKGERGMASLPRRVALDSAGNIALFVHPLIAQRMTYRSKEMKIRQTHFPLLVTATLKDGSYLSLGKVGIYKTDGVLHVDRRDAMDTSQGKHVRIGVAKLDVGKGNTKLKIFLDQDVVEVEVDESKMLSFITYGDEADIKMSGVEGFATFTMNPTKS